MAAAETRVLLTGAGEIARRVHIPYLLALPAKPTILVRDADPAAVTRAVRDFGLTPFERPAEESDASIAVICTPPATHAHFVTEALGLGMAVVCEKPLATSAEDARRILDASSRSGRPVFTCYTNRHRDDVRLLHEQLASGRIGQIRHVSVDWTRRWGVPGTAGAIESGVLWDLGSHLVDLALFLTGWSGQVQAFAAGLRSAPAGQGESVAGWYGAGDRVAAQRPLVDTVHGLARIGDGVLSVRASWNHLAPSDEVRVKASGTGGVLELRTVFGFSPDRQRIGSPCIRLAQPDCAGWRTVLDAQLRQPTEFQAQLDAAFGRPAPSALPPTAALELAVRSVSLCDAFARSLATGESVKVRLS